jgi:hypothetical protein
MAIMLIQDSDWKSLVATIARIDRNLNALSAKMEAGMSDMDDAMAAVTQQVQKNTDAEASAVQALHSLADLIQANATKPQVMLDLAAKLKAGADPLAAAIIDVTGGPQVNPEASAARAQ